ncbi:uncharacterized protein LOC129259378 [Lytechinus pictus]|uniref:uncharacterized protein LOC129259378 n=1 Tax=Lytechinus pictus TaxID=7653 RepID=UPI0030B9E4A1
MNFLTIFILIILVTCDTCMCKSKDERKTVLEGDSVHFHFPYPCNSTLITLQYGLREPFYSLSDNTDADIGPVEVDRFTFKIRKEHSHCSLFVRINSVIRTDEGLYIFFAFREGNVHGDSFKRIALDVDFLPGKAFCTQNEESATGNWVTLDCVALVESPSGQIDCYQNGEKMPPITSPTQTFQNLKQTIIAKKTYPVFCCTSFQGNATDMCECNDFVWDLANNKNLSSLIDPCGPLKSDQHGIQTIAPTITSPELVPSTLPTANKNCTPCSSDQLKYVFIIIGLILSLSIT